MTDIKTLTEKEYRKHLQEIGLTKEEINKTCSLVYKKRTT